MLLCSDGTIIYQPNCIKDNCIYWLNDQCKKEVYVEGWCINLKYMKEIKTKC